MSIIRQRRKNLIISGVLGFLIGAFILTACAYLYRVPLATWLQLTPASQVIVPELLPALVAAKPIEKGSILGMEDIRRILVEPSGKVVDHFADVTELVGKKTAIDIDTNVPFTQPMFVEDHLVQKDLRIYEVSSVELPYHLSEGDIVDIRIAFPTGQEYVVLSKKEVKGFERKIQNIHNGLLSLALEEEEALRMSSAMVDMFIAEGTRVYMAKYMDPDNQSAAVVNYPVNERVRQLILLNPNILGTPDMEEMYQSRGRLNAALADLLGDYDQPVVVVDMTTPIMVPGDEELRESISSEAVPDTSATEPVAPLTDGSEENTSSSSATDIGIGF